MNVLEQDEYVFIVKDNDVLDQLTFSVALISGAENAN